MNKFEKMGLSQTLLKSLAKMGYETPTPIQEQAIPLAIEGRDIMGTAQTGTGKTAAFAIPMVEKLLASPRGSALVLTPTRELGKQILDIMHQLLGHRSPIKTAFLIGGEPMGKQLSELRQRPRLIVGTPGRVFDHIERGNLMLHDASFLVLDETDRMLDIGFSVQLEKIFKFLPAQRQTLMFSATLPKNILKLSEKYLDKPARVAVGSAHTPSQNITQEIIRLPEDKKYSELIKQLHARDGSIIIFVKTKIGADRLTQKLRKEDFSAEAIHGDLRQSRRNQVIREFRKKNYRILVATDVAARGLDIPHIEHVINYDLPQVPEDYIHRIGRTARAGAEGAALCLISPIDGRKWHAIEQLMNPEKNLKPPSKGNNKPSKGKRFRPKHKRGGQKPAASNNGAPNHGNSGKGESNNGGSKNSHSNNGSFNKRKAKNGERKTTHADPAKNAGSRERSNEKNNRPQGSKPASRPALRPISGSGQTEQPRRAKRRYA